MNSNTIKRRLNKLERHLQAERASGVLAIVSIPWDMPEEEREAIIKAKEKEMEEAGCPVPLIEITDFKNCTMEDLENWRLKHES